MSNAARERGAVRAVREVPSVAAAVATAVDYDARIAARRAARAARLLAGLLTEDELLHGYARVEPRAVAS